MAHLSQEFIQNQKEKLLTLVSQINAEIVELRAGDPMNDPEHSNDNAAIDSDVRDQEQHLIVDAEVLDLQKRLEDIELAIGKIAKGTYGVCEKTNKPIPQGRLELVPEARFLVELE